MRKRCGWARRRRRFHDQVHFEGEPREQISDPYSAKLEQIMAPLRVVDVQNLRSLSSTDLRALLEALQAWTGPKGGEAYVYYEYRRLHDAVRGEDDRRRVERLRDDAGVGEVSLDNLDDRDKLPEDVFSPSCDSTRSFSDTNLHDALVRLDSRTHGARHRTARRRRRRGPCCRPNARPLSFPAPPSRGASLWHASSAPEGRVVKFQFS